MLYRALISLTVTLAIVGCSTNPVLNDGKTRTGLPFNTSPSANVSREVVVPTDPRIDQQAESINQFAMKMYLLLLKEGENVFFSPYSITSALGMADAGANGTTDEEIRKALQVTLPGDDFHSAINGLNQSLESHAAGTENLELAIENSIWAQDGPSFLSIGFLDKLARNYDAGVNLLDFINSPDSSRIIINNWVGDQTNQRILNLLPIGSISTDTRLVLTNAIYFLADWLIKFDKTKTDEQAFTRLDGNSITVPMMMLRDEKIKLLYSKIGTARMLELPYKGERLVMDLILPDSGVFSAYEASLTPAVLNNLISSLDSVALPPVRIPKFEFSTPSISLTKAFIKLGMVVPFTGGADFSKMSNLSLMISDIVHKAFIKVDEAGTEAAAATAVSFQITSMNPNVPSFVANRPFIYLIRDTQTNAILFMGRVLDPMVTQ